MSRSLVGSSSTSTLAGRANRRASSRRLRSPPDSDLTGERARCGANRKSPEVADDVLLLAADLDEVRARADDLGERQLGVELFAQLVEVGHRLARAAAHRALVGLDLAEDELQQRGLAGAVGADEADAVAAHDAGGEVAHHHLVAVALADMGELGHHLPALSPVSTARLTLPRRSRRAARSLRSASRRARGPRCGCGGPRRPCGSTPLPGRGTCRSARRPSPRPPAPRPCAAGSRRSAPGSSPAGRGRAR
jgi:hypothetical protein